jgi:outer membrane protein assembly factor BamE (lipoprotein component of BamABCDE complex)
MRNETVKNIFLLVILLASCGKPLPEFKNIDLRAWKEDKNGCSRVREKMLTRLQEQKDKLKGLTEADIIQLIGRPDQNELYKRNQKFFHYYIEPSVKCDSLNKNPKQLSIRFNAMERAKEVEIE